IEQLRAVRHGSADRMIRELLDAIDELQAQHDRCPECTRAAVMADPVARAAYEQNRRERFTTAWLIERTDVRLCYAQDLECHRWVSFVDPKAWRFDDKIAAERVIEERGLTNAVPVSHGWGR
ncbi:MAG: hypothetical protein WBW31_18110, partial [Candidatus Sulfotelmatobacter sp.]